MLSGIVALSEVLPGAASSLGSRLRAALGGSAYGGGRIAETEISDAGENVATAARAKTALPTEASGSFPRDQNFAGLDGVSQERQANMLADLQSALFKETLATGRMRMQSSFPLDGQVHGTMNFDRQALAGFHKALSYSYRGLRSLTTEGSAAREGQIEALSKHMLTNVVPNLHQLGVRTLVDSDYQMGHALKYFDVKLNPAFPLVQRNKVLNLNSVNQFREFMDVERSMLHPAIVEDIKRQRVRIGTAGKLWLTVLALLKGRA